jgi:hypothetical protein
MLLGIHEIGQIKTQGLGTDAAVESDSVKDKGIPSCFDWAAIFDFGYGRAFIHGDLVLLVVDLS